MKRTNLEWLQYDEFWENNNKNDIRDTVKRFIKQYEISEFCYRQSDETCDKLLKVNKELLTALKLAVNILPQCNSQDSYQLTSCIEGKETCLYCEVKHKVQKEINKST